MPVIQTQGVSGSAACSCPNWGSRMYDRWSLGLGLSSIGSAQKIGGPFVRIPAFVWTGVECCLEKCPDAMWWIANHKP